MLRSFVAAAHVALVTCASVNSRRPASLIHEPLQHGLTMHGVVEYMNREQASGFRDRPHSSTWHERLNRVLERGSAQGCDAPVWFCCHSQGLGAALTTAIHLMMVAVYVGDVGMIWKQPEVWPALLNQTFVWQIPTARCDEVSLFYPERGVRGPGEWWAQLRNVDFSYTRDMKRFMYQKLWCLTGQMKSRIASAVADTGGDLRPGGYIGVHVRRGDKIREGGYFPTIEYVERIIDARKFYPDVDKVYLASDDPHVRYEMQAMLGPSVRVYQSPVTPRMDPTSNSYQDDGVLFSTVRDCEILRHARVFIGTASSSMSRLVYFIRDENEQYPDVSLRSQWT